MMVFLLAVAGAAAALSQAIVPAFMANPALNGLIVGVLVIGVALNIRNVGRLGPEVNWVNGFRREESATVSSATRQPRLLASMANILAEHKGRSRVSLSAPAMRSLLDGISSRLDEERDLARYFIGLSIFLGLLGTFWGLLQTVGSISDVINSLEITGQQDMSAMFSQLKHGLEGPLQGMGTAFSSSLFGLTGSLILGFMDLQAGQAQNAFFNDLEEWLSGITKLSSGGGAGDGDQSVPFYIQALLEQTAESINELQRTIARGEDNRTSGMNSQRDLVDRLTSLTDMMRAEQQVLLKVAEGQVELRSFLGRMTETLSTLHAPAHVPAPVIDDSTRSHIRNMDVSMGRFLDESSRGRDEAVKEIRSEIKLLARTLAAIADESRK
jgi:hypothetical protein